MGNPIYVTTYCNFAHDVKTGKPIEHECIIIPPKALAAEMAGDYEAAIDILDNARKAGKLRTMRRGMKGGPLETVGGAMKGLGGDRRVRDEVIDRLEREQNELRRELRAGVEGRTRVSRDWIRETRVKIRQLGVQLKELYGVAHDDVDEGFFDGVADVPRWMR